MTEETYSIYSSTGFWVTRLARAIEADFEKRLKAYGMTRAAWAVLSAIFHDKKTTPAALASFIGIDGAAITRHLDRIEKQGLIVRDHSLSDRRSINIKVTKMGERLAPKIADESKATNEKFLAGMNSSEMDQFVAMARKMLANADAVPNKI